jgi:uncharacterized protein
MKQLTKFAFLLTIFCQFATVSVSHLYAQQSVFDIARKGTVQEMEDDRNSTPLLLACYRNNEAVALYLLDHCKDINYNSGMGTALMAAIMANNSTLVAKFIEKKADLNQTDKSGKTALIYAAFFNRNPLVKLLVDAGANKSILDADNRTALDYATTSKNTEAIIYLSN